MPHDACSTRRRTISRVGADGSQHVAGIMRGAAGQLTTLILWIWCSNASTRSLSAVSKRSAMPAASISLVRAAAKALNARAAYLRSSRCARIAYWQRRALTEDKMLLAKLRG